MKTDTFHIKQFFAELLGTFGFALVVLFGAAMGASPIMLGAIYLAVSVYTFSHISGAHFNPAITLGLFSTHKITMKETIGYITSQFFGAMLALVFFLAVTRGASYQPEFESDMQNILSVFLFEAMGALFFSMGVASVVWGKVSATLSGVVIGASLFVGLSLALAMTVAANPSLANILTASAYLNPALALTSKVLNMGYIVGPVVGAMLGMNIYRYLATDELEMAHPKKGHNK
jgi:glycerol uptake facilitator-like aquaporin